MRHNQFQERLNQIRTKYDHRNENQQNKYYMIMERNPQKNLEVTQNFKIDVQRANLNGISPSRCLQRQKNQQNNRIRIDKVPMHRQKQGKDHINQIQGFDTLNPGFKNVTNEHFSPHPTKKLRMEPSFEISPSKKDKSANQSQNYSILKPYNKVQTHYTPKSYKRQISFNMRQLNLTRYNPEFEQSKPIQRAVGPQRLFEPLDESRSFNRQKFDYNVNKIEKIQGKINSILTRRN